ncbi:MULTISPECIES: hypothetical protein [Halocynthiibacter]|uniref:DUF2306 domain-containing protein n=1 Tax=Halocynthiibacter halioticoli TaxID=2986804 RepID=A0AAE3J1Z0_9RHOB|nr:MULTISPECIES: hypothetical protein [Halocynthiibacter]MCV6825128.1 hypothetical protein [Halocynthiibacter halioticoli]MCW4058129.1 hypothetical protein [Halocynthiibacter sp. SDUM655004]
MTNPDVIALIAHISLGALAVVVGAIALGSRKGRKVHVSAGRMFVVSMGGTSVLGALLGALKFETYWITFHAGILGATLVASGVLAVRIRSRSATRLFIAVAAVNALNAAALFLAGWHATTLPNARLFDFAAADYFFLFGMAAIGCAGDVRMIFGNRISNSHRIAQHLVRMCIGFFIAAGSAFTGPGASVFPNAVQKSGILSLPELTIVLVMLFWLWRTLRQRRPQLTNHFGGSISAEKR